MMERVNVVNQHTFVNEEKALKVTMLELSL